MPVNNILIWGAGSQSLVLKTMIERGLVYFDRKYEENNKIFFLVDPFLDEPTYKTDIPFLNKKNAFKVALKQVNSFVVAIAGSSGMARVLISKELIKLGLKPLSVISSNSIIDKKTTLGKGIQVMPNTVINCYTRISNFSIINTSASIDHECSVGEGVHVMGGVSIAGRVKIKKYATIGTNATIIPDIEVASGSYVGAGAVVVKNIKKNQIVIGNPAKFLKDNIHNCSLDFFK